MTKELDNYSAFEGINLSNARSEDETHEQYRGRLRQNKEILKTYFTYGRDAFKDMFPDGVSEALQNSIAEDKKANAKKLGEAK